MNSVQFKPLGTIMNIIDKAGYEVTYAYDDLIFIGHSDFLIQFSDKDENAIKLFFHHELDKSREEQINKELQNALDGTEIKMELSGTFILKEKPESEEIDIIFNPYKKVFTGRGNRNNSMQR